MPDHSLRVTTSLNVASGPYGGNDVGSVHLSLRHPELDGETILLDELMQAIDEQVATARELLLVQLREWVDQQARRPKQEKEPSL